MMRSCHSYAGLFVRRRWWGPSSSSSSLALCTAGGSHSNGAVAATGASRLLASSSSSSSSSPSPSSDFKHPRAKELFEKIVASGLSDDDVLQLADAVNGILGRPIRANEFYYHGFGVGGGGRKAAGASSASASATDEAPPPPPSTADVRLVGFDASAKIKVIKEVRSILGLGLKEAKELVESAPKVLQKGAPLSAAEELRDKLVAAGAQVELG